MLDGVYHVENHNIPFRIFRVYEKYVDWLTPCTGFTRKTPPKDGGLCDNRLFKSSHKKEI